MGKEDPRRRTVAAGLRHVAPTPELAIGADSQALMGWRFSTHRWVDARLLWLSAIGGLLLLAGLSMALRPLLPVDETRYASVAWEMWHRNSFWVPLLNGEFYDHKPPLLFWLIQAGWTVFGVNDWWPRLIGPACALLNLWLLRRLAARLWPARPAIGSLAAVLFLGTWFVALYLGALMFEMPLLACILAAWLALLEVSQGNRRRWWLAFGLAQGLGLLVKGPIVLVYTLPPLLTLRWWKVGQDAISLWRVLVAMAVTLALPAVWLWLASADGSADYFGRLLFDQTLHRIGGQMGHPRPWYWYLPVLLLLPLPWTLWPPAWRAAMFAASSWSDHGIRFAWLTALPALLLLSLVAGKQVHYLLPALAPAMLGLSWGLHGPQDRRGLDGWLPLALLVALGLAIALTAAQRPELAFWLQRLPTWTALAPLGWAGLALYGRRQSLARQSGRLALGSVVNGALLMAAVFPVLEASQDLTPIARYVGVAQGQGRPVLYVGNYQGEFGFLGRLTQPVEGLAPDRVLPWLAAHPDGLVVVRDKRIDRADGLQIEFRSPFKSGELFALSAAEVLRTGSHLHDPVSDRY